MSILQLKLTAAEEILTTSHEEDFDVLTTKMPSGLYTTFRTFANKTRVVGLSAHLDRLYSPIVEMKIHAARDRGGAQTSIKALVSRIESAEARLRLILDTAAELGVIYILAQPLNPPSPEIYLNGIRTTLSERSRSTPDLKKTSFILESTDERQHKADDIYEILLMHDGQILEGMTSNFFYIKDGMLCTASGGILGGVTRQSVISIAQKMAISIRYENLAVSQIGEINEAFITSSSRGVVPVVEIAGQRVGDGNTGETTNKLRLAYEAAILEMSELL